MNTNPTRIIRAVTLIGLALFATITLFLSSSVLFDLFGMRAQQGNFVPLVVWANFLCSWLYVLALVGLLNQKTWAVWPLAGSLMLLLGATIVLYVHIERGGLFETQTITALLFRLIISLVLGVGTLISTKPRI